MIMKKEAPLLILAVFTVSFSMAQNVGVGTTTPNNLLQIGDAAELSNYHFAIGNGVQAMALHQEATASTWYSNNNFSLMPSGINTGYLGIGTNTPAYPLTLNTSPTVSSWGLFHTNGTVELGDYIYSTGIAEIGTRSAHPLYIFTNNSDAPPAIAIGVNGLVGINTTAPQTHLDIHGVNAQIRLTDNTTGNIASISRYTNRLEIGVPDIFQVAMGSIANPSFIILSSGNIGIGNNSPSNKLQIGSPTGFSGNDFAIGNNGKGMSFFQSALTSIWYSNANFALMPNGGGGFVGIGTVSPGTSLEVKSPDGTYGIIHSNTSGSIKVGTYVGNSGGWVGTQTNSPLYFFANNSNALITVLPNGNVGIGTINPTYKLSVNGTMQTKEVRVETGWADFVFEKEYVLPSLDFVENYALQNKHLPGIPSAKEIQENGLAVGDMQTKMMQKIEELTLYVIELKKEINHLKENNK
jgi:hypothetical protein